MSAIDPLLKRGLRWGWMASQSVLVFLGRSGRDRGIRVWYGGARAGNVGGPLVKVKRLRQFFTERKVGFSVVYTLSNTPYLFPFALKWLSWRKIPLVLNQNGVFYGAWFDGDWEKKNREMARAYHAADYVFWQSAFCRECADHFLGPRQGPGEILFNAVDVDQFRPGERRMTGAPVFLLTGKIDNHMYYRVEATIRAFARARRRGLEGRLVIAGWMAAQAMQQTKDLCRNLDLVDHVDLTGPYSQEEAPGIYQQADVYVMLKHNDPCPNTVIEALSSGLPVLYSTSGGVPELAVGKAGLGLPVEQGFDRSHLPAEDVIADGMLAILRDLPERRVAARRRAEEAFDMRRWIKRHETVFLDLLNG